MRGVALSFRRKAMIQKALTALSDEELRDMLICFEQNKFSCDQNACDIENVCMFNILGTRVTIRQDILYWAKDLAAARFCALV